MRRLLLGSRILFITLIALAAAAALAEPLNTDVTLADVTLGKHVLGEQLSPGSLEHRVVLFVFWKRSCKVCREAMQVLDRFQQEHAPAGLLVVASHTERGTLAEVRQTAEKLGLALPVVDDSTVAGLARPDPPHALLFDHTGRCIARGTPQEMAARAVRALEDAPPLVLAGRHLESLAGLERMLRDECNYGAVLRKAAEMAAAQDEATAAEAAYVIERLEAEAARLLARAAAVKETDAREAAGILQRVVNAFRGSEFAKAAAETLRAWRQEKPFLDGLQAAALATQLEAMRTQALAQLHDAGKGSEAGRAANQPASGLRVASMAEAARVSPQVKGAMAKVAGMVRQLSPASRYAGRAEEIILELGLDLPAAR